MKLSEWIDSRMEHSGLNRTEIRKELADASCVSMVTISHVDNGMNLRNYAKAKAISDATRGLVTSAEVMFK